MTLNLNIRSEIKQIVYVSTSEGMHIYWDQVLIGHQGQKVKNSAYKMYASFNKERLCRDSGSYFIKFEPVHEISNNLTFWQV